MKGMIEEKIKNIVRKEREELKAERKEKIKKIIHNIGNVIMRKNKPENEPIITAEEEFSNDLKNGIIIETDEMDPGICNKVDGKWYAYADGRDLPWAKVGWEMYCKIFHVVELDKIEADKIKAIKPRLSCYFYKDGKYYEKLAHYVDVDPLSHPEQSLD